MYVIFLGFEGVSLSSKSVIVSISEEAIRGIKAIHALGVLHEDVAFQNLLLQPKGHRPVWHDFERAVLVEQKESLGEISLNRERKRGGKLKTEGHSDPFRKEFNRAAVLL